MLIASTASQKTRVVRPFALIKRSTVATCGVAVVLSVGPAFSTVMEWNDEGAPVVHERPVEAPEEEADQPEAAKSAPVTNSGLERSLNQKVTREVALKFSGDDGVVAAGLTALEFIDLFEALIARESAFDHKAVSDKGAQGLGQLMPQTADDLQVNDPFDPYENLTASARYFTGLLKEFRRVDLALAAYNSGPTRVKALGRIPRIPETQNYVRAILKSAGQPVPQMAETAMGTKDRTEPQDGTRALEVSTQARDEVPLTGDVSVWEF